MVLAQLRERRDLERTARLEASAEGVQERTNVAGLHDQATVLLQDPIWVAIRVWVPD